MERLIKKGAEAEIWLGDWMGRRAIFKVRTKRNYMIEQLDRELRLQRTMKEAKMIADAKMAGVETPILYFVDMKSFSIIMEYVEGETLKSVFFSGTGSAESSFTLGRYIGLLHKKGIIHGDPTTSNFILKKGRLVAIDFGLAFYSTDVEDMAVDIHLIKEIISADMPEKYEAFYTSIIEGYRSVMKEMTEKVLQRARSIELRGRYARGKWG